jgi:uncharacterized protein
MKILVFSDSHGSLIEMKSVIEREKDIDMIFHLGDYAWDLDYVKDHMAFKIPIKKVRGNCDFGSGVPKELFFDVCGVKILMTHGNKLGVKQNLSKINYYAREKGADIVMYGHTHMPLLRNMGDLYILNPGSIGEPRTKGRTYAVVNIDEKGKNDIKIDMKKYLLF